MVEIDKDTAVAFDYSINLALKFLFMAGNELRGRVDPETAKIYDRAVARACSELDTEVLALVYRAHPDLKPDFLGGTRSTLDFVRPDLTSCPISSTLLQLNEFFAAESARSSGGTEIVALFHYVGLEAPPESSMDREDSLRWELAEEVERQK
ncbi:hypothetical protein [Bosea sp. BK604]|uniref:hypothetical protein n=1 Tax=Bosea sp. BK604 TaxID=2512180 RepID=UPI0010494E73|nr:hypothetical protein [Bosea sp. BK604]